MAEKRIHWLSYIIAISVLLIALACSLTAGIETTLPVTQPPATQTGQPILVNEAGLTVFSIEYAVPGLGEIYARTGVTYAKLQPIFGVWGNIEPEPSRFNWSATDALIVEYQQAGFSGLQVLITAESPWASVRPPSLGDKGDSFPKDEYLDDYARFVRRFVERYDADGNEDAPGLLYPVRHYGIEREFTGFWPSGDPDDYVRLLNIAYPEIKNADPEAKVILVALLLADVFDGDPPNDIAVERLVAKDLLGYSRAAMEKVLSACDAYDIADFHSLGDYTEIPPNTAWIRETLTQLGCPPKPIWIGDAFSMSALTGYNNPLASSDYRPFYPATGENVDRVVRLLEAVADPDSPEHSSASEWLQAEMAKGLVKKLTVSAGEQLAGINIGNLEDWAMKGLPQVNTGLVRSAGTSVFMGMIDTTISNKQSGTPFNPLDPVTRIRVPGEPRPAYAALSQFISLVGDYVYIEPCMNTPQGIWCYRFETLDGPIWVVWYEEGKLTFPGEDVPIIQPTLPVTGIKATIRLTPAYPNTPPPFSVNIEDSLINISVTDNPLFITVE